MCTKNSISGIALGIIGTTAICFSGIAAAVTYTVEQVNTPGFSATVGDKIFSNFNIVGADDEDSVSILQIGSLWQVDVIFTTGGSPALQPGTIAYQIDITNPNNFFYQASTALQGGGLSPVYSTSLTPTSLNPATVTATNAGSSPIGTFTSVLKTIQVASTWDAQGNNNYINSISQKFTQASGSINLVKTVGTNPNACANTNDITVEPGTTVYYCYTVTNTGIFPLTVHSLSDDKLGQLITNANYTLNPGNSVSTMGPGGLGVSASAVISVDTPNTATWTGCTSPTPGPQACFDASSIANVRVQKTPPPPSSGIPTMSEWAMLAMAGFMAVMGALGLRRRESA